ncbi:MAG: methyltransferase domain-containing protein [Magnetospirillum sp. WYHS-4]
MDRLDDVARQGYDHLTLQNRMSSFVIHRCLPFVLGPRVLSLGYAKDDWPESLAGLGHRVDIVEGAASHVEHARARFRDRDGIRVIHSTFEAFVADTRYDTVVAGGVVEMVADPRSLLTKTRKLAQPAGRMILTTANALSLHRRVGVALGIESSPYDLNERAKRTETRQLFDQAGLRALLDATGWAVQELFGCILKPFAEAQMRDWDNRMLEVLALSGDMVEADLCKELVAVCTPAAPRT